MDLQYVVTDVEIENVLLKKLLQYFLYLDSITSDTVVPKGHEPKLYEAGGSVAGLFLIIYISKHERT